MFQSLIRFDNIYTSGATLSKGLNRGMGTILGGGLGFLAAILARKAGGIGTPIIVGISLFVFGKDFDLTFFKKRQFNVAGLVVKNLIVMS